MRKIVSSLFLAVVAAFVGADQANADSITLYNTGVDGTGTSLPDGTVGDPHYSLISVPSGSTADLLVRTQAGGYPVPPYSPDSSTSAWIGPNNDLQVNGPAGYYIYRTTFSLAGLDPATASITGGWSSDNDGMQILLNGVDTGNPQTLGDQFQNGFAPFSITNGFAAGLNTLDFVVFNGGGPTALRVEMSGTADAAAVPEPSSLALAGLGGIGLIVGAIRRRRAAAV